MTSEQPFEPQHDDLVIELPNTRAAAAQARKRLVQFMRRLQIDDAVIADIETAAGEALANAAEHGYTPAGTIRLEARMTETGLEVLISDDGPGFASRPISADHPQALALRGYGLFLIHTLVDAVEFRKGGKTLWFLKRCR